MRWWESEAVAAWGQPGLALAGTAGEDAEARRAAYWLAACWGHCLASGGRPPGVLPPGVAAAAGRRLLAEAVRLEADALSLAATGPDTDSACGLVEMREQVRAAYLAVSDALAAAQAARHARAAELAALVDAVADATASADGAMLAAAPELRASLAGLPLLENMRRSLAWPYARPWWLDGRLDG